MTLARLIYILGIILIVYAIISGFKFHFSSSEAGTDFDSSYTFKIGTLIMGIVLFYLGRKSKKRGEEV